MENAETVATLRTQDKERIKKRNTTQKGKTMSNMYPTKKRGVNPGANLSFTGQVLSEWWTWMAERLWLWSMTWVTTLTPTCMASV
jgi:hypothetical protein